MQEKLNVVQATSLRYGDAAAILDRNTSREKKCFCNAITRREEIFFSRWQMGRKLEQNLLYVKTEKSTLQSKALR